MRFWVSWYQPTEDHRPIFFPPEKLLGWWCSGDSDRGDILCALLDADSEKEAKDVLAMYWPETRYIDDWRIWNHVDDDFTTGDRFPLSDWSPLKKETNDV